MLACLRLSHFYLESFWFHHGGIISKENSLWFGSRLYGFWIRRWYTFLTLSNPISIDWNTTEASFTAQIHQQFLQLLTWEKNIKVVQRVKESLQDCFAPDESTAEAGEGNTIHAVFSFGKGSKPLQILENIYWVRYCSPNDIFWSSVYFYLVTFSFNL